jgi:shikimate kinase
MGAGKTTVGRLLAKKLRLDFVDSDHEIELRTGADIPWIFDMEGETGFREREERVIEDLTLRDGIVLATGGGVVTRMANRRLLSDRGVVVYLRASLQQQISRTGKDRNRPLLQGSDPAGTLRKLMAEREPLYREIATHVMDTDGLSAQVMAQKLARMLHPA